MDFIDSRKKRISAWVKNDLRYRNFSVCYALYAAGIHFTKWFMLIKQLVTITTPPKPT